jgi:hypothetical protein
MCVYMMYKPIAHDQKQKEGERGRYVPGHHIQNNPSLTHSMSPHFARPATDAQINAASLPAPRGYNTKKVV